MTPNELDSSKIKILICCHKKCELPKDDIFLPIQVGAAISDVDLDMQRDDSINGKICDNISEKNKNYCELTAMYWAWKNIKEIYPNIDYIGLNHYRRYFDFKYRFGENISGIIHKKEDELSKYHLHYKSLKKLLRKDTVLFGKKLYWTTSLQNVYARNFHSRDYYIIERTVAKDFPEYYESFYKLMKQSNSYSICNMFIMPFDVYEKYCEWLFTVLGKIEKHVNLTGYSSYHRRIYGFIAEFLMNVYFEKHGMYKIVHRPIVSYDNESETSFFRNLIWTIKTTFSFFLIKPRFFVEYKESHFFEN